MRFHSTLSIHARSLAHSRTRHTSHQAKQQPIKPPKNSLICLQTFHRLSTTIIPTFRSTSPAPVLRVTLRVPALHHSRNTSSTPPPHPTTLPQHVLPFQAPASKTSPCLGNGLCPALSLASPIIHGSNQAPRAMPRRQQRAWREKRPPCNTHNLTMARFLLKSDALIADTGAGHMCKRIHTTGRWFRSCAPRRSTAQHSCRLQQHAQVRQASGLLHTSMCRAERSACSCR